MKNVKVYEGFKPKADLLLKFQLCRAYLNASGSILDVVEAILAEKFGGLHDTDKKIIRELRGKHNPTVNIPYREFKATVDEILSNYIEMRFDKMVAEVLSKKSTYPLKFRDIIERYIV
jgi:hypothetical protein